MLHKLWTGGAAVDGCDRETLVPVYDSAGAATLLRLHRCAIFTGPVQSER